jgi:NAD(P)-dependent dehydrogenase (short-subunit alcohol dehydrogenase family)
MMRAIPMGRFGKEGELDGALLLLASPAGSFMTGSMIVIDGGHVLAIGER